MRSGKHKSKENTWTEKDLTEALQGEKPRRSKDESRRRESREDGSQKRHSKERSHEEREKDRQRTKHEKSERRHEETSLDPGEGSSRRSNGTKNDRVDRDRERKHRDKSRGKLKDDDDNENSSGDRMKESQKRERNRDEDKDERRKERNKDESSRRERDESSRGKERSRNSKEDPERERERRHDSHDREKEANRRGKDKERRREKGERDRDKDEGRRGKEKDEGRSGKEKDERRKDKGKDERRRDKEKEERRRDREKEEGRGKEKDERRRDKGKDERRSDKEKEEGRRDRDKDERKREKEKGERRRDKEKEEETGSSDRRKDKHRRHREEEGEGDDDERERGKRRRRKEEESKERERSKKETESNDKDERRKENSDKERSEEDKEDRKRRREDREKRKQKEHGEKSGEKESESGRHKEGKETENEDDTRKKSKGKLELSNRSSSLHNEAEIDEEIANEDNYDEDNYEDDFEDYEDDYEDADEEDDENIESEHEKGKLLEIFEAINAENDDVRRSPFQQTTTQDSREEEVKAVHKPAKSSPEGRINFFAAKQKHVNEFVASKTKKRAQELRNLIELDVSSYDIFDLPPLNEYELYIKSYGQSDSKQAYVQCHDDIIEKEMQTEDIETSTKWTQYPPDDFKGCGEGDDSVDKDDLNLSPHSVDSVKLSNFLQQAGQVCLILLEEKVSGNADSMFKERSDIDISDGFIQFATKLPFIEGRRVLDMNFNSIQTHLLLTAHDSDSSQPSASGNDFLRGKGIVCFWNVNEPTQPQKILFCESSPMCCCFSPVKSSLVFAGLDDGSIVIWDVRESSSLHSTVEYKENQWVVRRPTFSTAGVFSNENHLSPVLNILPISLTKESAQASLRTSFVQDEPGGIAFQLASLEENGVVNIWVVIELEKPDEAGSESDLGLAPGGRVKLIKSTSIKVESPYREVFSSSFLQTSVMQFSTEDSNHFYVGTDRGWVVHCTRYGGRTQPKAYRSEIDAFVAVTAIDVSPWSIPIMLVGCADGTLRLHDLRKEFMIRSWSESTQGNPIVQVKWSRSRPSLFYVLDAKSNLYIWDLQQKNDCPVTTEYFKRGKLLSFSISNDYESLGIGLPGRKSELVLDYEGGIIELHRLKPTLTNVQADELDRFSSLVDSFV